MASYEVDLIDLGQKGEIQLISPVVMEDGSIVLVLSVHLKIGWHTQVSNVIAIQLYVNEDCSLIVKPFSINLTNKLAVLG
jgi:hypothetical protein